MKLIDNIVNKIGLDKITHFFAGSTIASWVIIPTILLNTNLIGLELLIVMAIAGFSLASAAGLIKEFLDSKTTMKDVLATCLGGISTALLSLVSFI